MVTFLYLFFILEFGRHVEKPIRASGYILSQKVVIKRKWLVLVISKHLN